jgi:glucose/arabinose dehydrogenase
LDISQLPMKLTRLIVITSVLVANSAPAIELPPGFVVETLATNLNAATAIAPAPDGRIFIAEQTGRLLVWKDGTILKRPALELHVTDYWERGLIGASLHPDFPRTLHLFVLYVTDRPFVHHVLSRFTLNGDVVERGSEQILFEGDDQSKLGGTVPAGHQGGPLCFGRDGKLYVGLGEQTAGEPAQRLNTLQGKILRLNPDGTIPEDNPFRAASGKFAAIFARGVRNPFGLALQPETGRMFFTDVGGSAFEEVNELAPAANYGWPRVEGYATNTAFKQPLYAYPPLVGQSIVGGVFLPRPSNWPEKWRGKFFFADFIKHWLKALDPESPTNVLTFARGLNGPVATELASDGSLLVLNRGALWRDPKKFVANAGSLVRIRYTGMASTVAVTNSPRIIGTVALGLPADPKQLPRRLMRRDWEQRTQGARRWPIWVNARPWHYLVRESPTDLYLPDRAKIKLSDAHGDVSLPPGAVVVRNFSVSFVRTNLPPKTDPTRHIETRLLVIGTPYSYGAAYRWVTDEDAALMEDGEIVTFSDVADGRRPSRLDWWFPPLDDAMSFPITNPSYWVSTAASDFVLVGRKPSPPINWLAEMMRRNALHTHFSVDVISNIPPVVRWEGSMPLEDRVRSYLHGNCAVCHQPGAPSRSFFDARITTPLSQAGILNGPVVAGDLGIAGAKIVVPGQPEKSILYQRLKATDFFRMPPVQYHNQPSPILPTVEQWIRGLRP